MKSEIQFKELETNVKNVFLVAEAARARGLDPVNKVEIPLATSLAEKVVGLISVRYPQIQDKKIINRILELEGEYGPLDPAVAFKIAEEIAKEKFCKFSSLLEAIDAGIRVGFAYSTLSVVSSPLEGFTELKLNKTEKNEDYFAAYFSGPIRSAGTTASCVVLMLIDYLRETFGYARYDPNEKEVKRYVTENYDYHERVNNLQYLPTEEEIAFLAENLPIQITGEASESKEVSNYKDIARIETNFIRGGMCLIFSEGLAQKAQKGLRILRALQAKGFKISDWEFLEKYVALHKKREKGTIDTTPSYIKDIVAGRPIFGYPSRSGAFRFRYGRSRSGGFSAMSIHPATMAITDSFLSIGAQLKVEKPTKGCALTACDSIDGPIVKLNNGSVRKIQNLDEAKKIYKEVKEIIYLGDLLVPIGDVINRNYELIKPGYVEEWWGMEVRKKSEGKEVIDKEISFDRAIEISAKYSVPLYPKFIYYWSQISIGDFFSLLDWLANASFAGKIILPYSKTDQERYKLGKRALEIIGAEHEVTIENVVLSEETSRAFLANLGVDVNKLNEKTFAEIVEEISLKIKGEEDVLKAISKISKFVICDKAGTFIGARMGRPEKAKLRKLPGSPNVLFPVGSEGGRLRSVNEAVSVGSVRAEFPLYFCKECKREQIYFKCEVCNGECSLLNFCRACNSVIGEGKCPEHGKSTTFYYKTLDMKGTFKNAVKSIGFSNGEAPILIKGVRGTSNEGHVAERLAKGILRAKYNLGVNKDGTIRYDATELPLTHFKPFEARASVEKLRAMGYTKDVYGKELERDDQILELFPHDILLPSCPETANERADEVFFQITKFMDNLLERFYKMPAYYNLKSKEDLIGHLVVCMAPHNCAGVIGRIAGFSKAQALLASPYMHAAMRRDCLGYENYVSVKKDGNWELVKIGEFIEKMKPSEAADNFGTLLSKAEGVWTWSNPGEKEVMEVTKHQPGEMIKVHLEDGRSIELTPGHKVYLKGKEEKRAFQLKEGEQVMVCYNREIEEKDISELFLPLIFKDREDVMIRGIFDYLSKFEKLSKNNNFSFRDSFPIKWVENFLAKYGKKLEDLPETARISMKRDKVELPLRIPLSKELLEVIGLYISEGHLRQGKTIKGFYQISISGNGEVRGFVKKVFYSHFGLNTTWETFDSVTFSSRIVYELFKDYLKCGIGAKSKRIPAVFLNLKKEKISSLLRGYYEGDGSVSLSDIRVACDTVSEGLKHDLSFVLSRFGIYTKFYEYEKEPGPKVRSFYERKNRAIPKFKITKVIILSDFVRKFRQIGFLFERKNKILEELCKMNPYGTKIDLDDNYAYPKVKKVEQIGEKISYCFNVLQEHNFFSNDILVHNCDGDEAAVMLLLDVLINFSRKYLPGHRGGTQDAPLVLNAKINAGEVDDQILDFETAEYPLELYELAMQGKHSSEVKIETVRSRLKAKTDPFTGIVCSHTTEDINDSVINSSYKSLPSMKEKVGRQMALVEKIRAVKAEDVARLIIERHFIRDIRGNLRKFSQQEFRCSKCNEKYRRPLLSGNCSKCNGRVIFTISEGSIVKYLEPTMELVKKYNLPTYVRQSVELTKSYIESIFGKEKEKQVELNEWF